jgi:hypothetical protein
MDIVRDVTPYVTISKERGGAGNPSPVTAYGVYGDKQLQNINLVLIHLQENEY